MPFFFYVTIWHRISDVGQAHNTVNHILNYIANSLRRQPLENPSPMTYLARTIWWQWSNLLCASFHSWQWYFIIVSWLQNVRRASVSVRTGVHREVVFAMIKPCRKWGVEICSESRHMSTKSGCQKRNPAEKLQRCWSIKCRADYSCILKAVNFYFLFSVLHKAISLHQK